MIKQQDDVKVLQTYYCQDNFDEIVIAILEFIAKSTAMIWEDKFKFSKQLAELVPGINKKLQSTTGVLHVFELVLKNETNLSIRYSGIKEKREVLK